MIPTNSTVVATSIGKIDVNVQTNQLLSFVFPLGIQLRSYASPHLVINVKKIIKFLFKIKKFSSKANLSEIFYQNRVWEDLLNITFEDKNTYGQKTSKLKVIVATVDTVVC